MTDPIRAALRESARHLCSYAGGPSSLNSCCQGVTRCEEIAAQVIHDFLRALTDGAVLTLLSKAPDPYYGWRDTLADAVLAAAKEKP